MEHTRPWGGQEGGGKARKGTLLTQEPLSASFPPFPGFTPFPSLPIHPFPFWLWLSLTAFLLSALLASCPFPSCSLALLSLSPQPPWIGQNWSIGLAN